MSPSLEREQPVVASAQVSLRQRAIGLATLLGSGLSNQLGAGFGALAFPAIGAFGVVAMRQFVAAAVLSVMRRPRFRGLPRRVLWLSVALAIVFGGMNLTLYMAMDRLGLGLAVTLEFLGPLAVAIGTSRRRVDVVGAILAAVGVVVMLAPGPSSDFLGIGIGLLSAVGWAGYILLNRELGKTMPGIQGTVNASVLSAAIWVVPSILWFATHPPTWGAIGLALVCGVLSSAVPYMVDMIVLRWVPTTLFGTFMSMQLIWAVFAGFVVLAQALTWHEWLGMLLIIGANTLVNVPRRAKTGGEKARI